MKSGIVPSDGGLSDLDSIGTTFFLLIPVRIYENRRNSSVFKKLLAHFSSDAEEGKFDSRSLAAF